MNIVVRYVYPPIPMRDFDYAAVDSDTYDGPGSPIGMGATREEAIADLMVQIEDSKE